MEISANSALRIQPENRGYLSALADFFTMFGAAVEASNAIQNGRHPSADVLAKLGLSSDAFAGYVA